MRRRRSVRTVEPDDEMRRNLTDVQHNQHMFRRLIRRFLIRGDSSTFIFRRIDSGSFPCTVVRVVECGTRCRGFWLKATAHRVFSHTSSSSFLRSRSRNLRTVRLLCMLAVITLWRTLGRAFLRPWLLPCVACMNDVVRAARVYG